MQTHLMDGRNDRKRLTTAPVCESKFKTMKIHFTKWSKGTYKTPHISVIINKGQWNYTQISFIVLNYHWWIIIEPKTK